MIVTGEDRSSESPHACRSDFESIHAEDDLTESNCHAERVIAARVLPRRTLELTAKARIDPFDREILDFILVWKPFGGPPDDECLPLFGLTPRQLERRVQALIENSRHNRYSPADRAKLVRAARVIARHGDGFDGASAADKRTGPARGAPEAMANGEVWA